MEELAPETPIPFLFFISLLHEISLASRRKRNTVSSGEATPTLRTFQNWAHELRCRYPNPPRGTTAALFRLLFPEEDVSRKFGVQETRLARYIAETFSLSMCPDGRGLSLVRWNAETSLGCLGHEVQAAMQHLSHAADDTMTLHDFDALLTELASNCPYSASSIRSSALAPRSTRVVLRDLYSKVTHEQASFVTQIILKDLRPVLYPVQDIHYRASLLEQNAKSFQVLSKESAMKAWDPSGRMLRAYRVRASLDAAAELSEDLGSFVKPLIGAPITIPKCTKGQGCLQSVRLLHRARKIWVETKYDGERAQIHVEFRGSLQPRITIFSKSKRDSTLDRFAIHQIIREALSPPRGTNQSPDVTDSSCRPLRKHVRRNIVIEAEMVAYSDTLARIDEFWRIRSLIASTAIGVRHSCTAAPYTRDEAISQCSMLSNGTDGGTRHLGLVFFDVLVLDDESLMNRPYSDRRAILESVITIIPGHSMLAENVAISCADGENSTAEKLARIFAQNIADHQEGVVLKADESVYNDWKLPWIKLKKDYIPGHGDTVDMVLLGAGWDKNRARELYVAPNVYTTFYLALLKGRAQPSATPHFEVIFSASYGLSREQLEELNFVIKSSNPVDYNSCQKADVLPYTFSIYTGTPPPMVMLSQPLLAEVFGAGFTKAPANKYYELRFPRITKVFRPSERSYEDGISVQVFQDIARKSVGRDKSGVKNELKRKRQEDVWFEKLQNPSNRASTKRRKVLPAIENLESENVSSPIPKMSTPPAKSNLITPLRQSQEVVPFSLASSLGSLLKDAVVWFARPTDVKRPTWRIPSNNVIPFGQRVNSLESLLLACGWTKTPEEPACQWANKGVVFVDDTSDCWLAYPMTSLLKQQSTLLEGCQGSKRKPLWILSMKALNQQVPSILEASVENYCLRELG